MDRGRRVSLRGLNSTLKLHLCQPSFIVIANSTVTHGPSRVVSCCCPQWLASHHHRGSPRLRASLVCEPIKTEADLPNKQNPLIRSCLLRVEKYRPIFLDDIVGNTETVERLKIIAKDGNMPHVIISGMPGIGKTTSVLCLARQLLGDAYKEAVLELNASDERGQDLFDFC